jgi:hypothetical protein
MPPTSPPAPPPILPKLGYALLTLTLLASLSSVRPAPSSNFVLALLAVIQPADILPQLQQSSPSSGDLPSKPTKFYLGLSAFSLVTCIFDVIYLIIQAPEITSLPEGASYGGSSKFALWMYILALICKFPIAGLSWELHVKVQGTSKNAKKSSYFEGGGGGGDVGLDGRSENGRPQSQSSYSDRGDDSSTTSPIKRSNDGGQQQQWNSPGGGGGPARRVGGNVAGLDDVELTRMASPTG